MIRTLCLAALAACAVPLLAMAQLDRAQDRYIVVLNEGPLLPEDVAADVAIQTGGRIGYVYETVLRGFTITMPRAALAGIESDPRVAYVEEDRPVSIVAQTVPTGIQRIFADENANIGIDGNDDWRVDADVAVLDTGIDVDHSDLNVAGGANCLGSSGGPPWSRTYECDPTGNYNDGHGHGTHVAGTVAAIDNGIGVVGVAPGARLWGVKVLDDQGSGSLGGVIAGIDWVVAQGNIEIINMSLGGSGQSDAMDTAVANAVNSGVVVVVAAGNSDGDAANHTPANSPESFTVSALADFNGEPGGLAGPTCRDDQDDTLADFSNWGSLIDIAAPGVCILSTLPGDTTGTYSGTSMASPHVAGAAALLASGSNPPTDKGGVDSIRTTLENEGNFNWTDDSGDGIKEPLLDVSNTTVFNPVMVSGGGGGGGATNSAPVASFTFDCTNDPTCSFDASGSSDPDGDALTYAWDFGDGTTGSGQTVNHTFACNATYTVTLTVSDASASDTESKSVAISKSPNGNCTTTTTVHIGDLDGSAANNGRSWTATVDIMVHDSGENAVNGATVTGDWSPVGGTDTCETVDVGRCKITLSGIPNNAKSVKFTVTGVTGDYQSGYNHDGDGDSDGTSITIAKPS